MKQILIGRSEISVIVTVLTSAGSIAVAIALFGLFLSV